MRSILLLPALLLAPVLSAQGIVSPGHFTLTEGNTYDHKIFSTSTPFRYLEIHDDLQGAPRTISKMSFRRDGVAGASSASDAFSMLCDIWMSTATTTAATPNKTFASNHGTDKLQVASFKLLQFPATLPGGLSRPFEYFVPLAQPFAFGGQGPLCWEMLVSSRTNTSTLPMDMVQSSDANPHAWTATIGVGCKSTGYTQAIYAYGGSSPNWAMNTMTLSYNAQNLPKNALVYLAFGNSIGSWSGVPLPIEVPGSGSGPSGVCSAYNNWMMTVPQLTTATGTLSAGLGVGVQPFYNGGSIYAQVVALDAGANPWGVVTSATLQHQVVAPYTAVPVGDVSSANLGANGSERANTGYVVLFE